MEAINNGLMIWLQQLGVAEGNLPLQKVDDLLIYNRLQGYI